jgi:hypothetical protein
MVWPRGGRGLFGAPRVRPLLGEHYCERSPLDRGKKPAEPHLHFADQRGWAGHLGGPQCGANCLSGLMRSTQWLCCSRRCKSCLPISNNAHGLRVLAASFSGSHGLCWPRLDCILSRHLSQGVASCNPCILSLKRGHHVAAMDL